MLGSNSTESHFFFYVARLPTPPPLRLYPPCCFERCVGEHSEGWFDPWAYVTALKAKATQLGVEFVNGEVRVFCSVRKQGRKGKAVDGVAQLIVQFCVYMTACGDYI